MKTATLSVSALVGGGSASSESAVDAYATRVLEASSPPEAFVDTSLGPYVTSVLRCTEIREKDEVTSLLDFDSLLELLEDQCNMEREAATEALKTIAHAIVTGKVPHDPSVVSPMRGLSAAAGGLYSIGGSSLDSFQSIQASLPSIQSQKLEQLAIDPYTPTAAGGPSPLKPDNLIPIDLLGVLDDPPPRQLQQTGQPMGSIAAVTPTTTNLHSPEHKAEEGKISNDEEAFPPLGASSNSNATTGKYSSSKKGRGKNKSSGKTKNSDKELAAALFRPSRLRQNSIEKEDSSPPLGSMGYPQSGQSMVMSGSTNSGRLPLHQENNFYFQQQCESCIEILLSMNSELSEEAATEACYMANADFNIAQFVVDSAMSAPPVCRHMLHDGCYRSDCQFSHDVEGHTCLFWLRGRCSKSTCKFLHGFNRKALDCLPAPTTDAVPPSSNPASISSPPGYNNGYNAGGGYSSSENSGFGGFSLSSASPAPTSKGQFASSWQTPSLVDPANSLSKGTPSSSPKNGANAFSFANIASKGYEKNKFASNSASPGTSLLSATLASSTGNNNSIPTVRIPQDLWNPHENRDSTVFYISDPMERYRQVSAATANKRRDVIDLHFQSTKTFGVVLEQVLPSRLSQQSEVWIVTGTGHHVGTKTHQKGGGALEKSVVHWLQEEGYHFARGKDRNGLGGAILVKRE